MTSATASRSPTPRAAGAGEPTACSAEELSTALTQLLDHYAPSVRLKAQAAALRLGRADLRRPLAELLARYRAATERAVAA